MKVDILSLYLSLFWFLFFSFSCVCVCGFVGVCGEEVDCVREREG